MKNLGILFSLATVLLFGGFAFLNDAVNVSGQSEKFVRNDMGIKGRYIVVLNDAVDHSKNDRTRSAPVAENIAARYNADVLQRFNKALNGFVAEMPEEEAIRLSRDPSVKYVEEDSIAYVSSVQNDAIWGLDRIDQRELPLNNTFMYSGTGSGVNAYILDTGIRPTHNEFNGRAFVAYDSIGDGQNGIDCHGHGTHVAGTIGSSSYGVAKDVTLFGVRVLPCSGYGLASQIVEGIDWVTENRIDPAVANISIGVSGLSPTIRNAINNSVTSGVTWVAAAGNINQDACNYSPSNAELAITVGATGADDARAPYSNFGSCVDIFAPGTSILSLGHNSDDDTRYRHGTSMAAPFVAGVAALYLGSNPTASPTDVTNRILSDSTTGMLTNLDPASPNRFLFSWLGNEAPPVPGMVTIIKEVHTSTGGTSSTDSFTFTASNLSNNEFVLIDNDEIPADRFIDTTVFPNGNDFDQIVVSLDEKQGWNTSDISCVESSMGGLPSLPNTTVNVSTRQAFIRVEEGEAVTCRFISYQIAPTSAPVTLSGRIVDTSGRGVGRADVMLHSFDGAEPRRVITSSFGYYQFDGVSVSNLYYIEVNDRRYVFDPPMRTIFVNEGLSNIDFIASPNTGQRR